MAALAAAGTAQTPYWYRRNPNPVPPTTHELYRMAYDSYRGVAVLVAIQQSSSSVQTWEWNGNVWTNRSTAPSPPSWHFDLVYDSARRVCVGVFADGGGIQTWEWNGAVWSFRSVTNPPRRIGSSMAYDSARQRTVLFGGEDGTWTRADTYEYDGTGWQQRSSGGPVGRTDASMAFDSVRQRTVLFGGKDPKSPPRWFADTWEWNGASWTEAFGVPGPSARASAGMAFDALKQRTILCGGSDGTSTAAAGAWEWNGTSWKLVTSSPQPLPIDQTTLAFDPARGSILLYGLRYPNPASLEFWERFDVTDPLARWTAFGTGCAGSAGVPTLSADPGSLPWIGSTLNSRVTNLPTSPTRVPFGILGASKTSWGTFTLPLDLTFIGMAGCTLFASVDLVTTLQATSGVAPWSITIPAEPALVGQSFWQQALVLDPGANILGFTASNAGEARVGVK